MTDWQALINNLDIIIPAYHASKKIVQTIFSFGSEYSFNFTIIIDGKEDTDNYATDLGIFNGIHNIKLFQLENNSGPGIARNVGMDLTERPLLTFIDSGDTIISTLHFRNLLAQAFQHPEYYMISSSHYEEAGDNLNTVAPSHNRMHGKIFRREFLNKYNIRFNPDSARSNEDFGFNMAARMICKNLSKQDDIDHICHYSEPVVCWRCDPDSITRQNDCAFYYQKNNMGLAKNSSYAIKIAESFDVQEEVINEILYSVLASLFNFYYSTVNYRPEFTEEQLEGALYFYNVIMQNREINYDLMTLYYNMEIANIYSQPWNPFKTKIPDMTFMQWYDMVKEKAKDYKIDN